MLSNGDTGPTPSVDTHEGRQDSTMVNRDAVFQRADGSLSDAWGNTIEAEDVQFENPIEPTPEQTSNYAAMTAQELKDEVARRVAEGREFDLSGVKVKADLVSLLEADDARQGA